MTTPKLSDQFCFAIYSTLLAINKSYRPLLEKLGLTYSQYLVMLVLWEQNQLTVSEIGEKLFLDSATLTPLLKRMENAHLIERNRSSKDERHVVVALTESGSNLRHQAARVMDTMVCNLDCPIDELNVLQTRLMQLRNNLIKRL